MGWRPADRPERLRLIADAYGLDREGRDGLLTAMEDAIDRIELAARRDHDEATLAQTGGIEKYDRRRTWWTEHRPRCAAALA